MYQNHLLKESVTTNETKREPEQKQEEEEGSVELRP